MRLQPGTFLQGDKYRIIDVLGQGGFGITYLAEQVMAERKVCIKEFFPKEYYKRDEDSRSISLGTQGSAEIMNAYKAKFIKEAKTIAKLDHPNIIHIFDVFTENNTAYYVMEYIDGESLGALVKERGALSESVAVDYIKQAASALGYIHERKIMHLDVKPANIMLRKEDGRPILIDFGLSKQYDAEGNQTSSTPVGISHGFAPMEQYQQGGVREFSPETDIYSLGATLYYLVTGCVPPQAAAIVDDGLPELPAHLSANVRNAIERSMEVQRKRRPHSMDEFVAMLCDGSVTTPVADKVGVVTTPISSIADESTKIGVSEDDQSTKIDASYTPTTKQNHKSPSTENTPTNIIKEKRSTIRWGLWLCGIGIVVIIIASILLNRPEDSAESGTTYAVERSGKVKDTVDENFQSGTTYAAERTGKVWGTVEEANNDAKAQWELTAEEVEYGIYELRFTATINPGFHGYPLTDMMSGPIFTWEDDSILVGEMTEPLASTLNNGEYEGKAEYVQRVKGKDGDVVEGYVLSTFCKGNLCTGSDCNFTVTLN